MKEEQNDIEQLIARSLAGETSTSEERQLAGWLKQDPANQQVFEKSKKAFALAKNYHANTADLLIDVDAEWNKFRSTVEGEAKTIEMGAFSNSVWYKIAATFLILLVSGAVLYFSLTNNSETIYETAQTAEIFTLPDNSTITLNKNSKLAYSKDFGTTDRKVTLTGEAFFDVTPDKKKTFIINTEKASIQVLGTSFNINTVDEGSTEVTVATGLVSLTSIDTQESIKLKAGDKGILIHENDDLIGNTNDDPNFLAWKTRVIAFENAELSQVVSTLNHVYNTQLILDEGIGSNCKVSVTFDNQSLDAVLNVLESTLELVFEQKEGQVNITDAGC